MLCDFYIVPFPFLSFSRPSLVRWSPSIHSPSMFRLSCKRLRFLYFVLSFGQGKPLELASLFTANALFLQVTIRYIVYNGLTNDCALMREGKR